jgi:hypothetical protein
LGVRVEGTVNALNTLFKEAHVFKNIVGLDAFVNKELWNMIWMKEYHGKFITILQIIYQRERLFTLTTRYPLPSIWLIGGRKSINVPSC